MLKIVLFGKTRRRGEARYEFYQIIVKMSEMEFHEINPFMAIGLTAYVQNSTLQWI